MSSLSSKALSYLVIVPIGLPALQVSSFLPSSNLISLGYLEAFEIDTFTV